MITAWIGSIVFLIAIILYVLLALGLPYGEFAMGGKYKVLPKQMRIICAISVFIQLFGVLSLLQTGNIINIDLLEPVSRGVSYFFAIFLSLNTIINAFSKSKKERFVMTPLSLIAAICFFLTAIYG